MPCGLDAWTLISGSLGEAANVAVGLTKAGRNDESLQVLRRVLRESPSFPQVRDARALLDELQEQEK